MNPLLQKPGKAALTKSVVASPLSILDPLPQIKFEYTPGSGGSMWIVAYVSHPIKTRVGDIATQPPRDKNEQIIPDATAVTDIAVIDAYRKTGLGQKLYDEAIKEAKKMGFRYFFSHWDRNSNSNPAWDRISKRYPTEFVPTLDRWQIDLQKVATHKTPALSDNTYMEGTNGWAGIPEKRKGQRTFVPLELMMPEEFGIEAKTASTITVQVMKGQDLRPLIQKDEDLLEETMYLRHSYLRNEPHMVAFDGGKVVGDCELQENPMNDDQFWFMHITTRRGYEGRGIARQLLQAAVDYVSKSGRHELKISAFSSDGEAKVKPVLERLAQQYPDVKVTFSLGKDASSSKTAKAGPHKNANVQICLPASVAAKVMKAAASIPDEELGTDGREDDPHITIKYGVKEDINLLHWAVGEQKPFTITLGKLHVFKPSESSGGQAPIVAEANAGDLNTLHVLVDAAVGTRKDDFDYKPHVTLAYVKPEFADKYEGSDLVQGISFPVRSVVLSGASGDRTGIPFGYAKTGSESIKAAAKLKPRPLPQADPPPREDFEGPIQAIRTDEGSIYWSYGYGKTHYMLAREKGIPAERIAGGGFIRDGVYEESHRSDSSRLGERGRASLAAGKYFKYAKIAFEEWEYPDFYYESSNDRTSPIEEFGWLLPNGVFEPALDGAHATALEHMGYKDYSSAFNAGLIRVWAYKNSLDFDTAKPFAEVEKVILQALKRSKCKLANIKAAGQAYIWDGKKFDRQMPRREFASSRVAGLTPAEEQLDTSYSAKYPEIPEGAKVDGREVIDNVDNMSSIAASIVNYLILEGIREVDFTQFDMPPHVTARTKALAQRIQQSGQLMPLIVGVDAQGPYIMEGSHRYDALKMLGAKSIPAVVVLDLDELLPQQKTSAAKRPLLHYLREATPDMAAAAQQVYDSWNQDEEGFDEENGTGGICDEIAQAITEVINQKVPIECFTTEGGQPGDDHAYVIAYINNEFGKEVYSVDIPPGVYETGGGYSWKKIPGVQIRASDVEIGALDIDPEEFSMEGSKAAKGKKLGDVYLLHFNIDPAVVVEAQRQDADTGIFHARHYLGWAEDAEKRIREHAEGTGARLTQVLKERGLSFTTAKIWQSKTRDFERQLKNQGGLSRHCPICKELGIDRDSLRKKKLNEQIQEVAASPETSDSGPDYLEQVKTSALKLSSIFYHGTTSDVLPRIEKEGLVPGMGGEIGEGSNLDAIYLTSNFRFAEDFAKHKSQFTGGAPVVLEVFIPDSMEHMMTLDPEDPNGLMFDAKIPSQWIKKTAKIVSQGTLLQLLEGLKTELALDAQLSYDNWQGNGRGICDSLAEGMAYTINTQLGHADPYSIADDSLGRATDINDSKSTHFWVYVERGDEKYGVDIPYGLYETETRPRFFSKIPDVKLTPNDVHIFPVKSPDDTPWDVIKDYKRGSQNLSTISSNGPLDVLVWRAGPLQDNFGRGIYFGGSREDAAAYSENHGGAEPLAYEVKAKNAYITRNQATLLQELFNKGWGDEVSRVDIQKFNGGNSMMAARTVEARMVKQLKKTGFDALVYTDPLPPAKLEVAAFGAKIQPVENNKQSSMKTAFKIEVPKASREHFWDEPPAGNLEFWAFKHPIVALPGEKILFQFDGVTVAEAIVSHTEDPGKTECQQTKKYKDHHKVFWNPKQFRTL